MHTISRLLLAAFLVAMSTFVFAESRALIPNGSDVAARILAAQSRIESSATGANTKSKALTSSAVSPLPSASPSRVYPPSCLSAPLPDVPSGPTYSRTLNLAAYKWSDNSYLLEEVTVIVWRIACSSSTTPTSATLMRIQRHPEHEGDIGVMPLFPQIQAAPVDFDFSQDPNFFGATFPRFAVEPNTISSEIWPGTALRDSKTFVLEGGASPDAVRWNFNEVLSLSFDNFVIGGPADYYGLVVPAYNPTPETYPAAFQNLPISGYMSSNWYDPSADGEGIVLQVYERRDDQTNLVVSFSWSAYDPNGIPFWLGGQVDIARGARTANAPMFYRTGGGFAGDNGAADPPIAWGTSSVSFPDCNTMTLTYAANPDLPAAVPTGSGTRTWTRVANVNALPCE
jgi:hypothetical protein